MTRNHILLTLTLVPLVLACPNDDNGGGFNGSVPMPALGMQIDRLGRAGVNTAVTNPFFTDLSMHRSLQDDFNLASNPDQWPSLFTFGNAGNLAIYDSLDRVCGNQLLAGGAAAAGRYDTLAGVLADDRLWVNSSSGTCDVYLAVEADATGVFPNGDCGGRTPFYDTIDVTYSIFAIGAFGGVGDGVAADADGAHSLMAFPFLDVPQ